MPQDNKLDAIRQMGAKAFSEAMGAGSQKQAIDNAVLHSITYTPIHKYIGWVLPLMEVRAKITEQLYGYKPGEVKTQMLLGELESINNLIKERLDITGIENYLKEIQ